MHDRLGVSDDLASIVAIGSSRSPELSVPNGGRGAALGVLIVRTKAPSILRQVVVVAREKAGPIDETITGGSVSEKLVRVGCGGTKRR